MLPVRIFVIAVLLLAPLWPAAAQSVADVCDKAEYRIAMRDGVKLHTTVYTPKNAVAAPILIQRTPYSCAPYGEGRFPKGLEKGYLRGYVDAGYILVFQDVRGRYMSEGEYENIRPAGSVDETTDASDTVEWLVHNLPHTNGRVGFFGSSYPGFYAMLGALSGHPAVVAASPQAPVADWFMGDDAHHNGVLMLADAFRFLPKMSHGGHTPCEKMPPSRRHDMSPDIYDFFLRAGSLSDMLRMVEPAGFWNDMAAHPDYDEWWQARDLRRRCRDVKPALLIVGGTFDAEDCFGAWNLYKAVRAQSPQTDCRLVVGPWSHGAWRSAGRRLGGFDFGREADWKYYVGRFERPFFDLHLRGDSSAVAVPPVSVFISGSDRWAEYDGWMPADAEPVRFYLAGGGALSTDRPSRRGGCSTYRSDPSSPVPYMEKCDTKRRKEYMVADQRFAAARPDVLTFVTEPLAEDMTLVGEVRVTLATAISTDDADFVVKLIDVYPDDGSDKAGCMMLVRGDVMRGRYRNGFSSPEAFVPDRPTEISFTMPDIARTFRRGHRVAVQIQSSWFPLAERSPQRFVDLWRCTKDDFVPCDVTIFHRRGAESYIEVGRLRNR